MQSAQNAIYSPPDCGDFRDHPWAGCGFIALVSPTTALSAIYESKRNLACAVASVCTVCLVTNTLTAWGQDVIWALYGQQL